ncbi:MAG: hypothetical protein WCO84_02180 [bacterium]
MKKIFNLMLALIVFLPFGVSAQLMNPEGISSEVNINKDGHVSVQNAKIMQFSGGTIYARLFWNEAFIRMTIKTDKKTTVTKKFGESMSISEMKISDRINIEGDLDNGSDGLVMNAISVKDLSDERGQNKISGLIIGEATSTTGYVLKTPDNKIVTLLVDGSTAIDKGTRRVGMFEVKVGNTVESAEGVFNFGTNTLQVSHMKVFIDMTQFLPRNFQGTIKSISGTSLPTTMTVGIDFRDYVVKIARDSWVWNNKKANTQISRFVVGDTVRIFGSVPESDLNVINAGIIRNLNL